MFMQVLLITFITLAGSFLAAADQCSLYNFANGKHHRCLPIDLFTIRNTSSSEIIDTFGKWCRKLVAYTSCMKEWSRNCADKDTIMTVVDAVGALCNGIEVADWFINEVAPTFDKVSHECYTALTAMPTCKATLKYSDIYSAYGTTTHEGIQLMKTYEEARYNCFKLDVQTNVANVSACSNVVWQDVLLYDIAYAYEGIRTRAFGRILTDDILNELKAMAT